VASPGSRYDLSRLYRLRRRVVDGLRPPAFKVKGKLLARLWEDGDTLVLRVGFDAREILMQADPEIYFNTAHYDGYPTVLVRLSRIAPDALAEALDTAWRFSAPPKLRAARGG